MLIAELQAETTEELSLNEADRCWLTDVAAAISNELQLARMACIWVAIALSFVAGLLVAAGSCFRL